MDVINLINMFLNLLTIILLLIIIKKSFKTSKENNIEDREKRLNNKITEKPHKKRFNLTSKLFPEKAVGKKNIFDNNKIVIIDKVEDNY